VHWPCWDWGRSAWGISGREHCSFLKIDLGPLNRQGARRVGARWPPRSDAWRRALPWGLAVVLGHVHRGRRLAVVQLAARFHFKPMPSRARWQRRRRGVRGLPLDQLDQMPAEPLGPNRVLVPIDICGKPVNSINRSNSINRFF